MPYSHSIVDSPSIRALIKADNEWHLVLDLSEAQLKAMMGNRALMEICRDETHDLQK